MTKILIITSVFPISNRSNKSDMKKTGYPNTERTYFKAMLICVINLKPYGNNRHPLNLPFNCPCHRLRQSGDVPTVRIVACTSRSMAWPTVAVLYGHWTTSCRQFEQQVWKLQRNDGISMFVMSSSRITKN